MEACLNWQCQSCGHVGLENGLDGFFYCLRCSTQAEDVIDTATNDEDVVTGGIYMARHRRKRTHVLEATLTSQHDPLYDSQPRLFKALGLEDLLPPQRKDDDPSIVTNLKSLSMVKALTYEDYLHSVRMRYVAGLQILLQLQCETLVDEFKVSHHICDHVEEIWLRFLMATNIFGDEWDDAIILESEEQQPEELSEDDVYKLHGKHRGEPRNIYGERAVIIWYKALKKEIPLDYTLAISFLACHLVREPVLPTDITKWAIEGKLPYLAAFVDIGKRIGPPERGCPITLKQMFNPSRDVSPLRIELVAATIADSIGRELPPVNFFEIASRYLRQLMLPHDKILPKAMLVYEWSMAPGLWLFKDKSRAPTRLCVLSILIVAIRMLYNINGFGYWERSLSSNVATSVKSRGKQAMDSDFNEEDAANEEDGAKLLCHLHSLYTGLPQSYEHEKDLQTYLKYCQDFVFAGFEPSYSSYEYEETKMMKQLWNYYQNCHEDKKDPSEPPHSCLKQKKLRDEGCSSSKIPSKRTMKKTQRLNLNLKKEPKTDNNGTQGDDEAIKILKLDMKEKEFHYIPPRTNVKRRFDYIRYVRKKEDGSLTFAAHADYYILLRACAQIAQVDVRVMHIEVLNFEKRLSSIEDQIEQTLCIIPQEIQCEHCKSLP